MRPLSMVNLPARPLGSTDPAGAKLIPFPCKRPARSPGAKVCPGRPFWTWARANGFVWLAAFLLLLVLAAGGFW